MYLTLIKAIFDLIKDQDQIILRLQSVDEEHFFSFVVFHFLFLIVKPLFFDLFVITKEVNLHLHSPIKERNNYIIQV
jgi:hypothetical protein